MKRKARNRSSKAHKLDRLDTNSRDDHRLLRVLPFRNSVWPVLAAVLSSALFIYLHNFREAGRDVKVLARSSENLQKTSENVSCSSDYKDETFPGCVPSLCGRVVMDNVVTTDEANSLLQLAKRAISLGGSNGGASVLDLHSGALSKGDSFVDIYKYVQAEDIRDIIRQQDLDIYRDVRKKIQNTIAHEFGIAEQKLYLTHPTFFSRITNRPSKTLHDEYWHPHIDKETYKTFFYTSLLYLSDYGQDFQGGRFVFIDPESNSTVEPRTGRLSFFTSGSENKHHVEKVTEGTRYAITVSFTCDEQFAISDPNIQ